MNVRGAVLLAGVLCQLLGFAATGAGMRLPDSLAGQLNGRERSIALHLRTGLEKYICIQGDRIYYYCLMNGSESPSARTAHDRCILPQTDTRTIILRR